MPNERAALRALFFFYSAREYNKTKREREREREQRERTRAEREREAGEKGRITMSNYMQQQHPLGNLGGVPIMSPVTASAAAAAAAAAAAGGGVFPGLPIQQAPAGVVVAAAAAEVRDINKIVCVCVLATAMKPTVVCVRSKWRDRCLWFYRTTQHQENNSSDVLVLCTSRDAIWMMIMISTHTESKENRQERQRQRQRKERITAFLDHCFFPFLLFSHFLSLVGKITKITMLLLVGLLSS